MKVAQLGRDRPRQLAPDSHSVCSLVRSPSQLPVIGPVSSLFKSPSVTQVGERAQPGRNRPRQLVVRQHKALPCRLESSPSSAGIGGGQLVEREPDALAGW